MHGFARHLTIWLVAAFFAAASVAWAGYGAPLQPATAAASADHGDHEHSHADAACLDTVGCSDLIDHGHDSESACCAFACHVIADLPCGTTLSHAAETWRHRVANPTALLGSVPVGPERPPRSA